MRMGLPCELNMFKKTLFGCNFVCNVKLIEIRPFTSSAFIVHVSFTANNTIAINFN